MVVQFTSMAMALGRFFSLDACQHSVDRTVYQYARIKKSPLVSFQSPDPSFSQIYVATNFDGEMNFVFMLKTPQYQPQSDEQILAILKVS